MDIQGGSLLGQECLQVLAIMNIIVQHIPNKQSVLDVAIEVAYPHAKSKVILIIKACAPHMLFRANGVNL